MPEFLDGYLDLAEPSLLPSSGTRSSACSRSSSSRRPSTSCATSSATGPTGSRSPSRASCGCWRSVGLTELTQERGAGFAGAGAGTVKLGELDLHLAGEGRHERIYERLGAHVTGDGVAFAVWAPNARGVSVVGDWNVGTAGRHRSSRRARPGSGPRSCPRPRRRVQVRGARRRRAAAPEVRPVRLPRRDPAEDGVADLPFPLRVGRRRLARPPALLRPAREPSRRTRSIRARGGSGSAGRIWPSSSSPTPASSASRTSSSCR